MELHGVKFNFMRTAVKNAAKRFGDIFSMPNDMTSHQHGVDKGYEKWADILSEYIEKTNKEMGWSK
jgi:hypothetical protein